MDEEDKYILKTEKEEVKLHYISLSSEDEKGWKRISLLNCNGIETKYKIIEIKVTAKVIIRNIEVSEINTDYPGEKNIRETTAIMKFTNEQTKTLGDITDIYIRIVDEENKIVEDWDLEIVLYQEKNSGNKNLPPKVRKTYTVIGVLILLFIVLIAAVLQHVHQLKDFDSILSFLARN